MADPQERDIAGNESATQESRNSPKGGKKKKKKRGCGFFILVLLLVAGIAAGIQASGGADFRPYVFSAVPKVPYIGKTLAGLLNVPEIYSFTPEERRRIELDEWEREIALAVRSLDERLQEIDVVSSDLSKKERELEAAMAEVAQKLEAMSNDASLRASGGLNDAQKAELEDIMRTFGEMNAKNAAGIIEQLNPPLAVAVLDGLAEDVRANVLGRMDAAVAAGLMEQLAELHRRRK